MSHTIASAGERKGALQKERGRSMRRRAFWMLASAVLVILLVVSNLLQFLSLGRIDYERSKALYRDCKDIVRESSIADHPACHKVMAASPPSYASSTEVSKPDDGDSQKLKASQQPTHHACDGFDGLLHIAMGDIGGAAGTVFFQFVVGQLLYAEKYNLKPWIHFNNVSSIIYDERVHGQGPGVTIQILEQRNASDIVRPNGYFRDRVPGVPSIVVPGTKKQRLHFDGTGVWEHYFERISDFVPGDKSCERVPYVTLDLKQITPGIHGFAEWAPRCWRYHYLPDYITKPHIPLHEWLAPHLQLGASVVQKYIRLKPEFYAAAQRVHPGCRHDNPCLGLHIRHSDKSAGRRVIAVDEFLPFAKAFVHEGGQHIYLATDSALVLKEIEETWPLNVRDRIRTMGDEIVRSSDTTPVFDMESHDRTNREILIEIAALSSCQYLVHGLSAVSDSVLWMNANLQQQSVNLELDDHMNSASFGTLVQMAQRGANSSQWPGPNGNPVVSRHRNWWDFRSRRDQRPTHKACEGFAGILHIRNVSPGATLGSGFFVDIINQLILAQKLNLVPWIQLDNQAERLYSSEGHGVEKASYGLKTDSNVHVGMIKGILTDTTRDMTSKQELVGNGIWQSYFEPVSDFVLGDSSCQGKEVASMNATSVADLALLPDSVNGDMADETIDWTEMRKRGSTVFRKYFRTAPHIAQRAAEVNPVRPGTACLALYFRHMEKSGKVRVPPDHYLEYVQAFLEAGGDHIYVGTDSRRFLLHLNNTFSDEIIAKMHTQGDNVVRMSKKWPLDMIDDHHRVNSEVLVDIMAMSKCQFLLHPYGAIAEAALYMNPDIQVESINLENPNRASPEKFGEIAQKIVSEAHESRPTPTIEYRDSKSVKVTSLNNCTILKLDRGRPCKSNAVVYLAQKIHSSYQRDSYGNLLRSVQLLRKNYLEIDNHIENLDIFIFHTSDFDERDLQTLEHHFDSSERGIVRLVNLTDSPYWRRPKNLEGENPDRWNAYPLFSEGYRRMIHFFAIDVWQFFADYAKTENGCEYRYIMRLDEDSYIHSPIKYDIFDKMTREKYTYGYRMCSYEMHIIRNIWTLFRQRNPNFVPKRDIDYQMCGFYNNFFVADVQFFLSDQVQQFLRFVDRRGAIYRRRLGDLLIHSTAVYAFANQSSIHRFLDFTYEHGTIDSTSSCLVWGGIQAGYADQNASSVIGEYYDKMIVERNCSASSWMMFENDLSPTHHHDIPPNYRGELSLQTISAGLVELPEKGILSG